MQLSGLPVSTLALGHGLEITFIQNGGSHSSLASRRTGTRKAPKKAESLGFWGLGGSDLVYSKGMVLLVYVRVVSLSPTTRQGCPTRLG